MSQNGELAKNLNPTMLGIYVASADNLADGQVAIPRLKQNGKLDIDATLEAGDIEIGAVELKNATDDTRAKINPGASLADADNLVGVKDPAVGLVADAAVSTDAPGTLSGKLRGLIKLLVDIISVKVRGTDRTIQRVSISVAAMGDNTVIAAPGVGNRIKIVHLAYQNTSGSDMTVIWKDGAAAINGLGFVHPNNAGFAFDAPGGPGMGEVMLADNAAFVLNLSAAGQVSGYCLYRTD